MRQALIDYALAVGLMLLQVLLFHRAIGAETTWVPVTLISILLLLVLSAFALLGGPGWRRGFLLSLALLLSGTLFSDLLFYRFFGRAIPLPAITGFQEAAGMGASIREALQRPDLLFLIAPLLLLLRWRFGPLDEDPAPPIDDPDRPSRSMATRAGAIVLIVAIGIGGTAGLARGLELFGRTTLQQLYQDNRVLTTGGAVAFHLADLMRLFRTTRSTDLLDQARRIQPSSGTKLRGIAKGKNLLLIQLESTESFLIGRS